jgi:hypothetical protein
MSLSGPGGAHSEGLIGAGFPRSRLFSWIWFLNLSTDVLQNSFFPGFKIQDIPMFLKDVKNFTSPFFFQIFF